MCSIFLLGCEPYIYIYIEKSVTSKRHAVEGSATSQFHICRQHPRCVARQGGGLGWQPLCIQNACSAELASSACEAPCVMHAALVADTAIDSGKCRCPRGWWPGGALDSSAITLHSRCLAGLPACLPWRSTEHRRPWWRWQKTVRSAASRIAGPLIHYFSLTAC